MRFKGTMLVMATLIIQIVAIVLILLVAFDVIFFGLNLVMAFVIYLIYKGFDAGEEKWIMVAGVTGISLFLLALLSGSISISGILLVISAIIAHTKRKEDIL